MGPDDSHSVTGLVTDNNLHWKYKLSVNCKHILFSEVTLKTADHLMSWKKKWWQWLILSKFSHRLFLVFVFESPDQIPSRLKQQFKKKKKKGNKIVLLVTLSWSFLFLNSSLETTIPCDKFFPWIGRPWSLTAYYFYRKQDQNFHSLIHMNYSRRRF